MRHWMENLGWLQGSVVKSEDVAKILELAGKSELTAQDIVLIVASGSCDIASLSDPVVEFSIARSINAIDGNYNFNKNPRKIHCQLESASFHNINVELKAHEKIVINKNFIPQGIEPNLEIKFSQKELNFYVDWLAARYKRPAFPTEFDRRIDQQWNRKKRKKVVSQVSSKLIGIYAKVLPDKEISEKENYSVNLLALVVPELTVEDKSNILEVINKYKEVMIAAKMDVVIGPTLTEDKIAVATLKQYKRFNLDDLSYTNDDPLPPEITALH
ncbi:hypothetical protein GWP85_07090 [Acinetobacter beijerinckii]|uniref:hypothetical protein n=1 Tax=Acinetobacter beijerinckii TaxID=262668 RepID=UPI0023DDB13E|nr:hypothetical protein [Acinetobacter beijerinckii]MDF2417283.1 hypothetical protein [Acinetobacter beijerinckii]